MHVSLMSLPEHGAFPAVDILVTNLLQGNVEDSDGDLTVLYEYQNIKEIPASSAGWYN